MSQVAVCPDRQIRFPRRAFAAAAAVALCVAALPAWADDAGEDGDLEVVAVCATWDEETRTWRMYSPADDTGCDIIGSRRSDRSVSGSPVPVDIIQVSDLIAQGDNRLDSLLSSVVPSFNVSQGGDSAMLMRPVTLRGLAPDATLVLLNRKRRHRGAVISLLGYGIASGAQGPDLASIPAIALERVEVLRDGASAQYGSDAIAGALNLVLSQAASGMTLDAKWGSHFEGDGDALTLSGNIGLAPGDGFANLSFEWKEADPTSRSVQRADAAALIAAGNMAVRQPVAQVWGLPRVEDDIKLFANVGTPIGENADAYAFGNWAERQVEGGFYYRNPHGRIGVFRGDPLADGTPTVKVADLTGTGSGNCPALTVVDNRADPAALAAIRNNPRCYSLIERFPGGFTPQYGAHIGDRSLTAGVRGNASNGWRWDASAGIGRNSASFYIHNTVNPQLLSQRNAIPTHYEIGVYTETDRVVNLDLAKAFNTGAFDGPLHVAFGMEYRDETFAIEAGDRNSYFVDTNLENGLAAQGFDIGSNGAPGFRPSDAGENTVSAWGAYLDLESDVSEALLLGGALRYENYADFGDTFDGKVTARYRLSDNFALRGAVSTGFRVPTAGQANLRNVLTSFRSVDGVRRLVDIAILPPTSPVAERKGAKPLTPEQSRNITAGAVFNVGGLDVTVDYYNIEVTDRISLTSAFALTQADVDALLAAGVQDAQSIREVRFFSNEQTVEISGVDLVASWPFDLAAGRSVVTLAANFSDINLSEYNPAFTSENRRSEIEEGRPESRLAATWTYNVGRWSVITRVRNYGEYYDAPIGGGGWGAYRPERVTVMDAELTFDLTAALSLVFGAQNLLDTYPQKNPNEGVPAFNGQPYPENSPVGYNGGFYYVSVNWHMD